MRPRSRRAWWDFRKPRRYHLRCQGPVVIYPEVAETVIVVCKDHG